jgi:hypothetical protein
LQAQVPDYRHAASAYRITVVTGCDPMLFEPRWTCFRRSASAS